MKCGSCGSELLEDSIYCNVCGKMVRGGDSAVVSYADLPYGTVIVCPKCGAKNSRTDLWCGKCDADLDSVKKTRAMPAPKGPTCPKCGTRGYDNSNYCRRCGQSFVNIQTERSLGSVLGETLLGASFEQVAPQREIIRERQVIMVRCKYCGSLNGPDVQRCSSCGGQM